MAVAVTDGRFVQHRRVEAIVQAVQDLAFGEWQDPAQQSEIHVVADNRGYLQNLAPGLAQSLQTTVEDVLDGQRHKRAQFLPLSASPATIGQVGAAFGYERTHQLAGK